MNLQKSAGTLFGAVVIAAVVWGAVVGHPPLLAQGPPDKPSVVDPYQRSADNYTFTATAKSGPQRGEELYYYKCWFCHNQFASRAPYLKELFKRPNVTDQTVADKIRNGGPGMPSYRTTLKDADVADLVSYLRERCCWEGQDAPPNPRYILGNKR